MQEVVVQGHMLMSNLDDIAKLESTMVKLRMKLRMVVDNDDIVERSLRRVCEIHAYRSPIKSNEVQLVRGIHSCPALLPHRRQSPSPFAALQGDGKRGRFQNSK